MNKHEVGRKVAVMAILCLIFVTIVFTIALNKQKKDIQESQKKYNNGAMLVAVNELQVLNEKNDPALTEKLVDFKTLVQEYNHYEGPNYLVAAYVMCVVVVLIFLGVIYIMILRPFDELVDYASEIAAGNLDAEVKYKRVNMFGQFTWAFDHMRYEIINARRNEKAAILNNKTVIATLSHDIKTPVASIRGYAEALSMNMDNTAERRKRYIDTILKKCDEVTKITNDMFLHSLHDLDKLVIKHEEVKLSEVIKETLEDMNETGDDIIIEGEIKDCTVKDADAGRVTQVIENIISNARKYAPGTKLNIKTSIINENADKYYMLAIKDGGKGIPDSDMPFIFDKFYRGNNAKDEPGAGLGLYIVRYIMQQMKGKVELDNSEDGLCVKLFFNIL